MNFEKSLPRGDGNPADIDAVNMVIETLGQEPSKDAVSREAAINTLTWLGKKRNELKKDTMQVLEAYISPNGIGFPDVKDAIKDLLEWSKNEYNRGWCDALSKVLKEAYTIHSEEGIFQVIQAETLIELGYAIDDPQAESEEK